MEFLTELVGVSFRPASAKEVVDNLEMGQELTLRREPSNPYDSNAIQVIEPETEEFIGFIKGADAQDIAPYLDTGGYEVASCTVVSFLGKRRPGLKVILSDGE